MRTKLIVTAFSISIFWAVSLGIYRPSSAAQPVNPSSDPHLLAPADEAPRYGDYVTQFLYIPMRDDVQIAIDVVLPKGLPANEKIPTILNQTRYWRAYDFRRIAGDPKLLDPRRDFKLFFAQRGYALIFADVRGTGASFGSNPYPWSPDEIQDGNDIVEWIIAQPWSDGRVGAIGVSYEGSTAQFLAVPNHPAVKAVIPQFMEYDVYSHIAFPGGVFNDWFVRVWSHQNSLLDRNIICEDTTPDCRLSRLFIRGVKPVDSDRHRGQLRQAIQEHQQNGDLYGAAQNVTFRDDYSTELQTTIDGFSVHTYNPAIEQSNIAIYGWGSWMDAGTADGVINRLLTLRNPQKAIIGPWNHGASQDADPFLPSNTPVQPSVPEQRRMALRFFDFYLKDIDTGIMSEPALTYYTLGEGKWKVTDVWPPAGVMNQRWYLAADGALSRNAPIFASGEDTYSTFAVNGA